VVERLDHAVHVATFRFVGADIAPQPADGQGIGLRGQPVQLPGLSDDLGADQRPVIDQGAAKIRCLQRIGRPLLGVVDRHRWSCHAMTVTEVRTVGERSVRTATGAAD
jgi:hypothetical protein